MMFAYFQGEGYLLYPLQTVPEDFKYKTVLPFSLYEIANKKVKFTVVGERPYYEENMGYIFCKYKEDDRLIGVCFVADEKFKNQKHVDRTKQLLFSCLHALYYWDDSIGGM